MAYLMTTHILLQLTTEKEQFMQLGEKITLMRTLKGLTQEEMAARLNMSTTGYAKIERGETKLQNPRLEKIAEVFGLELSELLSTDTKNIFNFAENCTHSNLAHCTVYLTETQCVHELEKAHLMIEQLNKEVVYLKEIIELMKNKNDTMGIEYPA
jgi:transcriptional regulator with XRE-family HTH domain